jgi:hypothetical protein
MQRSEWLRWSCGVFVVVAAVLLDPVRLAGTGRTPRRGVRPAEARERPPCLTRLPRDVELTGPAVVDRIEVVLASSSPPRAAFDIVVATEGTNRVLRASGNAARILQFRPAMRGRHFRVSAHPVTGTPPACVARIALAAGTRTVAQLSP